MGSVCDHNLDFFNVQKMRIIFLIVIVRDVHGTSIGINVEYSYWMMLTDMSLIKMCLLDPKL